MTYTLYGSQTSPFVRRIRILMENIPHELKEVDIYDPAETITFNKISPIHQIPVLQDGDQVVWDSRHIFNYLNLNHKIQNLDWDDENLLTAIDEALNSGANLMKMKRSGMNIDEPYMYNVRLKDRMESILDYLKPMIEDRFLKEWDFHSISLYCFLDWALFRKIINLEKRPECQKFLDAHAEKSIVKSTSIPKA